MSKTAFYLTRQAARMLRDIHTHSIKQWGEATADRYMTELYAVMNKIAADPALGKVRKHRSTPFLMVPAGKHYVVYDAFAKGVVILTLLHQHRDIECLIADGEPRFLAEIMAIKQSLKS